jgi:choline kinase
VKAVILCAGAGTRLLPRTQYMPKTLLPIGGRPILGYQLEALRGTVDEVVVATGYLAEQVRSFLAGVATIAHNDLYASTNSLYSLWLAREHVRGDAFILLNGDVLYDRQLLLQVLDHPMPTALLVDAGRPLVEGEMNVVVRAGAVTEIGKEIPTSRATAQSLQMVKFNPSDSELLFDRIGQLVEAGETGRFPTYAYDSIFRRSRMAAIQRSGGVWFEIDTPEDLARCEQALLALSAGRDGLRD